MTISEAAAQTMRRGDSFTFDVTVTQSGAALDISAYSIWCTGKRALTDADADAVFQITKTGGDITVTGASSNVAHVVIPASATTALTTNTTLFVDVQIKSGANVYTVTTFRLGIYLDVTRTTS